MDSSDNQYRLVLPCLTEGEGHRVTNPWALSPVVNLLVHLFQAVEERLQARNPWDQSPVVIQYLVGKVALNPAAATIVVQSQAEAEPRSTSQCLEGRSFLKAVWR